MEINEDTTNFLNRNQIQKLIKTIPKVSCYNRNTIARRPLGSEAFQLLIKIQYDGALRITEASNIKPKDIDFQISELELPNTKTGWEWCKCAKLKKGPAWTNKGGIKIRGLISVDKNCKKCNGKGKLRVPQFTSLPTSLTKEIENFIKKRNIDSKDYLFASPSFPHQPIGRKWIWQYLVEAGKLCNLNILARYKKKRIKNVYTHLIRKSKAKQMLKDGFEIGEVAAKLRHLDIKVTTTYVKAEHEDLVKKEREIYG